MRFYFNTIWLLALVGSLLLVGCSGDKSSSTNEAGAATPELKPILGEPKIPVRIVGKLKNVQADAIMLYDVWGPEQAPIASARIEKDGKDGSFELVAKVPEEGVYYLGFGKENGVEVVLGIEDPVTLSGDVNDLAASITFQQSGVNAAYTAFRLKMETFQKIIFNNQQQAKQAYANGAQAELNQLLAENDKAFANQRIYLEEAKKQQGFVGKVAQIYAFEVYDEKVHKEKYATEQVYFIQQFFNDIDFSDPKLGYIPLLHDKFQQFTTVLMSRYGMGYREVVPILNDIIAKAPEGSKLRAMLLLAASNGAAQAQGHPNQIDVYVAFAKPLVELVPEAPFSERLQNDLKRFGGMGLGSVAPDIALPDASGKVRKLSDLRGKVVLLDFWASWCRPCRMENPNVVRVYNKYNKKGFEVFSVSLDQDEAAWQQAIKQDGLIWPTHVSDLQGWQSSAATAYNVTGIPFTLLIDKEGKIIEKNLRGPELERALAEYLK